MEFPNKKYSIIYADPPWNFNNRMYSSNKNDHHRAITRAYSVMTVAELCHMNDFINDLADNNCALFMWSADAFIPSAIAVMNAWGFKYKTVAFIWQKKEKSGKQVCFMGQWTMKGSELVLLGTKGKMTQYLKSRKVRQLQEATRERNIHSRKPQLIRDKIIEMFGGDLPRIELFARQKVEGWDCWGDEVGLSVIDSLEETYDEDNFDYEQIGFRAVEIDGTRDISK